MKDRGKNGSVKDKKKCLSAELVVISAGTAAVSPGTKFPSGKKKLVCTFSLYIFHKYGYLCLIISQCGLIGPQRASDFQCLCVYLCVQMDEYLYKLRV